MTAPSFAKALSVVTSLAPASVVVFERILSELVSFAQAVGNEDVSVSLLASLAKCIEGGHGKFKEEVCFLFPASPSNYSDPVG